MQDKLDKLKNQFKQDQQKVREEESDLADSEDQTETGLEREEEEIEKGEAAGNPAEIEDAEEKMEKILNFLKKEEKEADDIESRIEDELEIELDEARIIEEMEGSLDKEFSDAVRRLRKHKENFQEVKEKRQKVPKRYYSEIEETLQDVRYAAEVFRRELKKEDELFEQLEETEKEEDNFDQLFQRLERELDMDKNEVRELVRDSEQIGISEDVDEAREEGQELETLIEHVKQEEGGVRQIESEIEKEIQEIGNILGEDEKILEEMESCVQLLEELDEIMRSEKGILNFGRNSNAKNVLDDIEKTDQQLKTMLNKDRDFIQALEDSYDRITGSSRSLRGRLINKKTVVALIVIVLLVLAYGFVQGNL